MCLWLHQKGCAHWTVKSKINSAWQGFYLCVFGDKPFQIDRKGVIILALLLQRCHTQSPSNNLAPFPTLSPSRQPRSSVCSHRRGFTAPQSQPHEPRVSPDYRRHENCFRPIAARCRWHGEHRRKSNAGRPSGAYWMPLPLAQRGRGAAPIPSGTWGVWAMAVPVTSALPRDTAGCQTSAINITKLWGVLFLKTG